MSQQNIEIVSALYRALAGRDLPALFRAVDPLITVTQTEALPWGGEYHGEAGLKDFLTLLLQNVDSRVEVEECFEAGDQVVVIGRTVGEARGSGMRFDVRAVHVWTVEGGKVTRFEPYIDTPAMLAALYRKGPR